MRSRVLLTAFLPVLLALTDAASAQMGPPAQPGTWSQSLRGSWIYQAESSLEGGEGDFGFQFFDAAYDLNYALDGGASLGASVGWSRLNSSFSAAPAPWDDVSLLDLGISWRQPFSGDWMLLATPSVEFARESGADSSDALRYGGFVAASRRFNPNLTLGFGAAGYVGLEDSSVYPILMVRWQFAPQWRLSNPFRPGPTGPAGLEVVYSGIPDWELGLGGGYRSIRFLLDEANAFPSGFGEVTTVPIFLRATRPFGDGGRFDLYLGGSFRGQLSLDDRDGTRRASDSVDSAFIGGLSATFDW